MNPDLMAQLQQYAQLQQMMGGFAPNLPRSFGDPTRLQASQAGQHDVVRMLEQLMGRRGPAEVPQQTRQQQQPYGNPKPAPSMGGYNPFSVIEQEALR